MHLLTLFSREFLDVTNDNAMHAETGINLYVEFVDAALDSLRSRHLEVVGTGKKGCARRRHMRGVSPSCAPVLSFTHYLQAPAMQASP